MTPDAACPDVAKPEATADGAADEAPVKPAAVPAADLPLHMARGYIELVRDKTVGGWAWCEAAPDLPLEVEVHVDGVLIKRVLADRPRPDLQSAGYGNGCHGFLVHLDEPVSGGERDRVTAFIVHEGRDEQVPLRHYVHKPSPTETKPHNSGNAGASAPSVPWTDLLAQQTDLRKALLGIGNEFKRLRSDQPQTDPALKADLTKATSQLQAIEESLAHYAAQLEIIETRLDVAVAAVKERDTAMGERRGSRGLYWAVATLAGISITSLAIGVYSILI